MSYKAITTVLALSAAITACAQTGNSPWLHKVLEYRPAPGQFINELPEYEPGDNESTILTKVSEQICGSEKPGMISLGSFGGYVIVAFDHPVVNIKDRPDFRIFGNAVLQGNGESGSSEPGIVMVSVDENRNGIPDDPWYELAGSDYALESTLKNYTAVYEKPDPAATADPDPEYRYITDRKYIRWTDNNNGSGYVMKNTAHTQSYWPEWIEEKTMTFTGTRLAPNATDADGKGGNYKQKPLGWGYVDNLPDNLDEGFDIGRAVDDNGRPVILDQIDFIRIHTGVMQYCGWIGETSTEVCGGQDLHPDAAAYVDGVKTDKAGWFVGSAGEAITVFSDAPRNLTLWSVGGMKLDSVKAETGITHHDISGLGKGIYILTDGKGNSVKISI